MVLWNDFDERCLECHRTLVVQAKDMAVGTFTTSLLSWIARAGMWVIDIQWQRLKGLEGTKVVSYT
jgi:hypothetical protein